MRKPVDGFVLLSAGESRTFPWKAHVVYYTKQIQRTLLYKKIEDSYTNFKELPLYKKSTGIWHLMIQIF